jgi:hypothetical protein
MRRAFLSVFSLMVACQTADGVDGETQAGSEGTGDGDGDGDGDEACFDVLENIENCGLPQPCATVEFVSDPSCETDATYDPLAAACILDELAAGTLAEHQITDCPGGTATKSWTLQVLGDGSVLWSEVEEQGLMTQLRGSWRELPEPAYFESCQTDTPEQLLDCIEAILEQICHLGDPICPE